MFDIIFSYREAIFNGAIRTVQFTAVGFAGAVVLGLVLALMRKARWPVFRAVSRSYTELIKNLPLLTTIFIFYFGLTSVGINLDTFRAGCLSLTVFYGAYLAEIFRGSLLSVGRGQREAAQATGLTGWTTLRAVVLPHAIRIALPGAGTMLVDLLKATSLLVTIGGAELMGAGQSMASETFAPLQVYVGIGLVYFLLCFPLSFGVGRLENLTNSGAPIFPGRRRLHHRIREYVGPMAERSVRSY